jgi:transaldolase
MTKLHKLADIGQAIWLDYIRRSLITEGGLQDFVDKGVRGVTSNPAIFEKAIAHSDDYNETLRECKGKDMSPQEIYEKLALEDIQMAADVLRPLYDETDGADGFVSLEVSPDLAYKTEETIAEARRLFKAVDRPNVLIKVPATPEGIPAIETLIGEGVNVNVTLMFSLQQYHDVAEAYLSGLEALAENDEDLKHTASVASFFVSRVDVMVDEMLEEMDDPRAESIKGTIGIANAKMAYQRFKATFRGDRWQNLLDQGARYQRVLWASTSTKNPDYSDTLYPDNLIGPYTVNTLPPDTIEAFLDHGTVAATVESGLDRARTQLLTLEELGIDLNQVTDDLLDEGVEKFARPFASLMESIDEKMAALNDD